MTSEQQAAIKKALQDLVNATAVEPIDFGVSLGPEIPQLATARQDPSVQRAQRSIQAAMAEVGAIGGVVALADAIAGLFGISL